MFPLQLQLWQKGANLALAASRTPHTPLPLDGLRGLIAERLSASWNERPQVTLHSEVDATELVAVRNRKLTPAGKKISFNAYFVAAVSRALAEFPRSQFSID